MFAHVGSSATGDRIARAAVLTGAYVIRENGGNDPLLVDADVDPGWAAEQAAIGAFSNSGQICTSVERIYVHRSIAEPFCEALAGQARDRNTESRLAPLVDTRMRDTVHRHVAEALQLGARAVEGGTVPDGPGAFYPATVLLDCTDTMDVMAEETFGPVAPVRVVDSFEEGLTLAAAGRYGLAATVLTGSIAHAQQAIAALPVGTVKVNEVFGGAPGGAAQPRGESGHGFGYGPELLDEFSRVKVVHIAAPPARPGAASARKHQAGQAIDDRPSRLPGFQNSAVLRRGFPGGWPRNILPSPWWATSCSTAGGAARSTGCAARPRLPWWTSPGVTLPPAAPPTPP